MSEPIDMIAPLLRSIQEDLTTIRADVGLMKREMRDLNDKFDRLERRVTALVGRDGMREFAIDEHGDQIAALAKRVEALEAGR